MQTNRSFPLKNRFSYTMIYRLIRIEHTHKYWPTRHLMYIKVVLAHLYFFDEIINCNYHIYLKNTVIFKILKLNVKTTLKLVPICLSIRFV